MTITNGYATLLQFQQRTGLTDAQLTAKTTLIEREIERNSRVIDRITGDIYYTKTLTASRVNFDMGINADGLYMSEDATRIYFPGQILSLTSVVSDTATMTVDVDYIKGVSFIEATNLFTMNRKTGVLITGSCGYASTPDDINEVCLAMTEVTTGLGTYTMIDSGGSKMEVTRDNLPDWVADRLFERRRLFNYA